jgi:hypothetical protein
MAESDALRELMRAVTAPMTPEDEELLWLNLAVVAKIVDDPERALVIAMQNLRQLERAQTEPGPSLAHWRIVLNAGVDAVIGVLTSRDPVATRLRRNSPFQRVLARTEEERALEAFRRHRKQAHAGR